MRSRVPHCLLGLALLFLGAGAPLAQTADLAVSKHLTPDAPVIIGDQAVFTITVSNLGPDAATGVVVKDELPAGLSFASAEATQGAFDGIDWTVGALAVGQSETLTLTTILTTPAPQVNCAVIKDPQQNDPNNANDADCAEVKPKYTGVDLVLEKTSDSATAQQNELVTWTIRVTNLGPEDATNILIRDELPQGIDFVSASPALGAFAGSAWTIPVLSAGQATTLDLVTRVKTEDPRMNCAAVEHVHPGDRDPSNDEACACVNCEPSGGDDSGIESDGSLVTLLANRLFERRRAAADRFERGVERERSAFTAEAGGAALSAFHRSATPLAAVIPTTGPAGTSAIDTTPADLLGVTNATAVAAADYVRQDGHRLAALFGAATSGGVLYDHAKATCDRLAGATLRGVQHLTVAGHPFVMQRLTRADGTLDYSVSFVAYRVGPGFVVDSRFAPGEYAAPAGSAEVLNLQVWSVRPDYTRELVEAALGNLAAEGTLSFLNTEANAPALPGVYVRSGQYRNGAFTMEIANPAGVTTLDVTGARSLVESGAPQAVSFSMPLSGEPVETITLATGPTFDAVLTLASEASGEDQVYFADAPWSYAFDEAGAFVNTFATWPQPALFPEDVLGLERPARFVGSVATWASLFRYLSPQGLPRDVSHADYVEFTAAGQGTFRLVLEKASVEGWDQFATTFTAGATETIRVPFDALARADGSTGFTGEDVVLVGFYPVAGDEATPFDLYVSDLHFGGEGLVSNEDESTALAFALEAPFPNPALGASRIGFTLPEAAEVNLEVFDVLGRRVAVLAEGTRPGGRHEATVEAGSLAAGAYLVRLRAGDHVSTTRLTVVR